MKYLVFLLQRNGPPKPCPPRNPNCDPLAVPIDGWVLVLMGVGVLYGIYLLTQRYRK